MGKWLGRMGGLRAHHALENNRKAPRGDAGAQGEGHGRGHWGARRHGRSGAAGEAGDVHHARAQGEGEKGAAAGAHGRARVQGNAIQLCHQRARAARHVVLGARSGLCQPLRALAPDGRVGRERHAGEGHAPGAAAGLVRAVLGQGQGPARGMRGAGAEGGRLHWLRGGVGVAACSVRSPGAATFAGRAKTHESSVALDEAAASARKKAWRIFAIKRRDGGHAVTASTEWHRVAGRRRGGRNAPSRHESTPHQAIFCATSRMALAPHHSASFSSSPWEGPVTKVVPLAGESDSSLSNYFLGAFAT